MNKTTRMKKGLLAAFVFSCSLALNPGHAQNKIITYQASQADFPNPERGFYIPIGSGPGTLKVADLQKYRNPAAGQKITPNAEYSAPVTLVYRGYLLKDFKTAPLSPAFLQGLEQDMKAVREAGQKLVLRFAYTNDAKNGQCGDTYQICPPYGDASKETVLGHIAQLKPILTQNADVIAVMQQGFIGIWGENYYTDHFGVPSQNPGKVLTEQNWRDRNEVLKALLDALPADRSVQARTPQMKIKYVGGFNAPITAATMTEAQAFTETDRARIGLHNDCFLASWNDYGTFEFFGFKDEPKGSANKILRKYFEDESRYVAVGGETCDDTFSPENDCAPAGHADQEMAAMHYSYLNASYNNQVNNDWVTGGCMDNIKRNLGYRLVLKSALLPKKLKRKQRLAVSLELENVGYAAPFNPRPVQLILRNTTSGQVYTLPFQIEIRKWYTGAVTLKGSFALPGGLSKGTYELLLNLPDAAEKLSKRQEYSIRLANDGTWEPTTGYNKLLHELTIR